MTDGLRRWQRNTIDTYAEANARDFLIVATPGAGKTRVALEIARARVETGRAKKVVVIVPSVRLKFQWAHVASDTVDLELEPNWGNGDYRFPSGFDGIVTTYQQVTMGATGPQVFRTLVNETTFVIFDEIHHCGQELSWGDRLVQAFENAGFRLALSGTPFRGDNRQIPFIRYDAETGSKADVEYTYGDALQDDVCRPIYFPRRGGKMEWWDKDGNVREASFADDLTEEEASRRLKTALTAGDWLPSVLADANADLTELRESDPDAGGLVIAIDQPHARTIAHMMREQLGEDPSLAISEEPEASGVIEDFTRSRKKWLIAVRMVSEGVDIPRLRVGVYATNVADSELFFRQAVGRFVRAEPTNDHDHALVFLPDDTRLIKFAEDIKDQRNHQLEQALCREFEREGENGAEPAGWLPLDSTGAEDAGSVGFDSEHVTPEELAHAESLRLGNRGYRTWPAVRIAQLIRDARAFPAPKAREEDSPASEPMYKKRENLRKLNEQIVRTVAVTLGLEFKNVSADLNRAVGIQSVKTATNDQLEARARRAQAWLKHGRLSGA